MKCLCPKDNELTENAFPSFAPLLKSCQDYARLSGCRFRCSSFERTPGLGDAAAAVCAGPRALAVIAKKSGSSMAFTTRSLPRLAARRKARPAVVRYTARLKAGEEHLVEEVRKAYGVVWEESLRNIMMAKFAELGMWPPDMPADSPRDDCSYSDLSAPALVIAVRLWNDEVQRCDLSGRRKSQSRARAPARARTASFIADFAHEVSDIRVPPDEALLVPMQEFEARIEEYRNAEKLKFSPRSETYFFPSRGRHLVEIRLESETGMASVDDDGSIGDSTATIAGTLALVGQGGQMIVGGVYDVATTVATTGVELYAEAFMFPVESIRHGYRVLTD